MTSSHPKAGEAAAVRELEAKQAIFTEKSCENRAPRAQTPLPHTGCVLPSTVRITAAPCRSVMMPLEETLTDTQKRRPVLVHNDHSTSSAH
ncbi:hypothetical protein JOB18_004391 [Solea senegalensis]|uniref:Uncharacterized protein n=1 Tax=Solea senegalensis TaxID=28829 RepID=A0AAV6SVW0_SOLSE|nr:hypothetical protein JOB18_004391 [Solea senegalensis]